MPQKAQTSITVSLIKSRITVTLKKISENAVLIAAIAAAIAALGSWWTAVQVKNIQFTDSYHVTCFAEQLESEVENPYTTFNTTCRFSNFGDKPITIDRVSAILPGNDWEWQTITDVVDVESKIDEYRVLDRLDLFIAGNSQKIVDITFDVGKENIDIDATFEFTSTKNGISKSSTFPLRSK